MSKQIAELSEAIDRLISEHTRLRVENQSLTLRIRELERTAASSGERVKHARARLDALIAQLPLEDTTKDDPPEASQSSLL